MLDLINDPAATQVFLESWTIVQAARTSRPIEKKRLDEAFRKVAARHEALRARFARRSGGWHMIVEDSHRTGPVVTDLGPVSDTELKTVIAAMAREPFDIENGPLFKLDVLRCGGRGDVLLLRAHHLVTDGWSQIMVADEMIRASLGLPFSGTTPLSYGDYLKRFERAASPAQEAANEAYWQRTILPALATPHLGRVAKGLEPNYSGVLLGPAAKLVSVIEARDVENLRRTAKSAGCSLSNLIQAAFATVLARRGGVEGVYFNTPFASRARPELQSFVGLVCDFLPVRCDVAAAGSLENLARSIADQLRNSYAHAPARATKCDHTFDDLVNGAGGHLRQFECGMLIPEGAMRGSMLAPMLGGGNLRSLKLGAAEVEWIDINSVRSTSAELDLRTLEAGNELKLIVAYDTLAFTGAEVGEIVDDLRLLLGSPRQSISYADAC